MSLVRTSAKPTVTLDGLGMWMRVSGSRPHEFVRVSMKFSSLQLLDPHLFQDDLEAFTRHRANIEKAASIKFDQGQIDDERYQGQRWITLTSNEIPGPDSKTN